jgi:alpha-beta hydrolase superfamily lysophospholipase
MLIVAIHGILTRQTNASWPDHLDAWMRERHPEVKVLKKEYAAGPFPRWNCWWKNPRLARGLAAELRLFPGDEPLWLVAHSNGANIVLLTLPHLLASQGRVTGILLTGAACAADTQQNGVAGWLASGQLSQAIAYCARNDAALPRVRTGRPSAA